MMISTSMANNSLSYRRVVDDRCTTLSVDRKQAIKHDDRANSAKDALMDRRRNKMPNSAISALSYLADESRNVTPLLPPPPLVLPLILVLSLLELLDLDALSSLLVELVVILVVGWFSSSKVPNSSAASMAQNLTTEEHKCGKLFAKKTRSVPCDTSSQVNDDNEYRGPRRTRTNGGRRLIYTCMMYQYVLIS